MRFVPDRISVGPGDRIVWENRDLVPHTVTHQAFDSRTIAPNGSWTYIAQKRGEFPYVCTFHPGMKAVLVVK